MTDSNQETALAPATADTPAPDPATARLHAQIDAWFAAHFHNSIVSRDTETFNHVHAAKEDLKRLLSQGD
jgi:hypothetical protein